MIILLLFIIVKGSVRDTKAFLAYAFDYNISVGSIIKTLDDATVKASEINDAYDLSNCVNSSTDELFHQGKPILAAADIDSKFCMMLKKADDRDHNTWGCHLLDLIEKGYHPNTNIMDGGSGMKKAFEEVCGDVTIRYDHFHIIYEAKNVSRFLKNKKESAITEAIRASSSADTTLTTTQSEILDAATTAMKDADYIYQQFKILTDWLQYDVLQLQSVHHKDRSEMFDFIVAELIVLAEQHPHRIRSFVTTLENQKEKLLDAVGELNILFESIAKKYKISIDIVWGICNFTRFSLHAENYYIQSVELFSKLGEIYDDIEDEVLEAISKVHRTSSTIENFNSRLRPYLDPRKGFKEKRYSLIRFALNHLPFQRSANESHKGKSAAEIFSRKNHIDFLSLLGFQKFKKAA